MLGVQQTLRSSAAQVTFTAECQRIDMGSESKMSTLLIPRKPFLVLWSKALKLTVSKLTRKFNGPFKSL